MNEHTRSLLPISIACISAITLFAAFSGCDVSHYLSTSFVSITVTPQDAKLPFEGTMQLTATATTRDGSTADVTNQVTWSSSNTAAATVDPATGMATAGTSVGTTTITASIDGISGGATLDVLNLALQSLTVAPASAQVDINGSKQFTATGTYSDGSTTVTQDITSQATWSSSNTSIATVDAGFASGIAAGTVTITASKSSKSGTASLTVTNQVGGTITSISVTPQSAQLKAGSQKKFTATATLSDGSTNDVTSTGEVTWSSSNTSVATVDTKGVATVSQTALAGQTADIVATSKTNSSVSGKGTITVLCATCSY